MSVARLRLAPLGETVFPPRAPFFRVRLGPCGEQVGGWAEEKEAGNLPVSAAVAVDAGGTSRFPQTPSTGPLRGQAAARPPAHRRKACR
jgi:hypothetical protein